MIEKIDGFEINFNDKSKRIINIDITDEILNKLIFPSGTLSEIDYLIRFVVVILSIGVFYLTKKNLVYPTLFSAIILSIFSSYL